MGQKALASRILGLLWEMVMNPEAPPELSRGNGLVEAISHYGEAYAWDYMQRCVQKVASNDNAHTALHMLRRLCEVGVLRQVPPSASPPAMLPSRLASGCSLGAGPLLCLGAGSSRPLIMSVSWQPLAASVPVHA